MKARKYCIINAAVRQLFLRDFHSAPTDGSVSITISATGSKSARQRGLQHIWYHDIIMSGLGGTHESTEESLDLFCKYKWGIQILTVDEIGPNEDGHLGDAFVEYSLKHKSDPKRMMWWTRQNIHTESMDNNQMAQFLTRIQEHYAHEMGVNLTDPDARGWDSLLKIAEEVA